MNTPVIKQLSENKEFFYAAALILLIPAAFILNTALLIRGLNDTFDTELTSKANLATSVIGSTLKDSLADTKILGKSVAEVTNSSKEIEGLTILNFKDGQPNVLASGEGGEALSTESVLLTKLAWATGQPYTTRLKVLNYEGKTSRVWQVSLPITGVRNSNKNAKSQGEETEVLGIVNLKVSGEKTDVLISKLERDAVIFTVVTLVIVILLLLNHFRFFGYARLFQKLKEVDEMKDNFISLASHELRTPVTALRGYASLLIEDLRRGDLQTALSDSVKIARNSDGINELVNDLLDVSRIEQKRLKLQIQNIDLTQSVSTVIQELKVQADQKGLTLNYVRPTSPLVIAADAQKLKQILVNLIGNAIKYTEKGEVFISHEVYGNQVKTLIKDSGIGIPAEEIPNLFEKFHRVQNEATSKIRGTGLGLWITKQLVEIMAGKILVESIQNTGTKIIISFPIKRG